MEGKHLEGRTVSSGSVLSTTGVSISGPVAHHHQPGHVHFTALTDLQRLLVNGFLKLLGSPRRLETKDRAGWAYPTFKTLPCLKRCHLYSILQTIQTLSLLSFCGGFPGVSDLCNRN